ncbi:MAG: hypothetical protein ACE5PV_19070 [Candidatus Poribacteria bacterium]
MGDGELTMQREIEFDGKIFYYDYDEYQDALFITFSKQVSSVANCRTGAVGWV